MRWTPCFLTLGLAACAGEAPPRGGEAPAEAERTTLPTSLVPDDTVALLVVPSAQDLLGSVAEALAPFGEGAAPFPTDLVTLLELFGAAGDLEQVDPERPLAMAFSLEAGPSVAFLLPLRNEEAFAASLSEAPTPFHLADGYALLGARPTRRASGLAIDLPPGLVSLRLDVASVKGLLLPLLAQGLQEAGDQEGASPFTLDLLTPGLELGQELLDGARTLDLSLGWDAGRLTLDGSFDLVPGSAFAAWIVDEPTGAATLARGIDPQAAVMIAGGVAPTVLRERLLPWSRSLIDSYPEALRAGMLASIENMEPHYDQVGRSFAGSQDFGVEGMRYAYLLEPDDPETVAEALLESFCTTPFLETDGLAPIHGEEDGVTFTRIPFAMDGSAMAVTVVPDDPREEAELEAAMGRLLGEEMELVIGRRGSHVAAAVGQTPDVHAALERVRSAEGPPPPLAPLLREHGSANPLLVAHMDLARLMRGTLELAASLVDEEAPVLPKDLTVGIQLYAAGADGRLHGGLRFDLASLARMVEALNR